MSAKDTAFYDLTPLTMLDYPEHLACILWIAGCSMRCGYCYNPAIVRAKEGSLDEDAFFAFLKKRQGLLDAVVLSGGECTGYAGIERLCKKIKKAGFKIKIDTNGTNPDVLHNLITKKYVDYIALDYKAPPYKFTDLTGYAHFETFSKSLDCVIASGIDKEVRTTVHSALLDEKDIQAIADDLYVRGYRETYYLQKYKETENTLKPMPAISNDWLNLTKIEAQFPLEVRC